MLEYTYKERFCPTIRYSVSEDGKWFCTEGREGGNKWRSWMWLPELNPDCTCISTSAAGYRIWSLCCGIAALLFLVLAAVQWGMENFTSRGDRLGNVFFVLVVCVVFGGLALVLNILWRRKRGTVLNFDSFLQDRRIVLILPYGTDPKAVPFVRELRRRMAGMFRHYRPDLNRPDNVEQLRKAFDSLKTDEILTDDEYDALNRKLFGGSVPQRNIGFELA